MELTSDFNMHRLIFSYGQPFIVCSWELSRLRYCLWSSLHWMTILLILITSDSFLSYKWCRFVRIYSGWLSLLYLGGVAHNIVCQLHWKFYRQRVLYQESDLVHALTLPPKKFLELTVNFLSCYDIHFRHQRLNEVISPNFISILW